MAESALLITIDSRQALINAQAINKELQSIDKTGDFASKSMDSLSVATRTLAGHMAGLVTVGAAVSKMDAYTQIGNKLKIVTANQEQLNRAMEDTFAIAQRSYSSWNAVNDVYSKYMSNAKNLNLTQAQVAKLTEITSKAVALSGSSAESAAGALFQYGQSLDGNILRAEEFNSLVDGAGGLLNAMATGLGVTRGQLRQMMLDGKLTGEVITKALLKAGDSVEELHKKTDVTIGQSLVMLSDGITKFVGEADHASGASKVTSEAIRTLSENIEPLANGTIAIGIGLITKALITKSLAVRSSIAESFQQKAATVAETQAQVQLTGSIALRAKQTTALTITELNLARVEYNQATTATARAVAIQRVTAAEVAHGIAVKNATIASTAYTAAQNAETLATSRLASAKSLLLGLTGGWVGLAASVVGVAAGYLLMRDNGNEANKTLQNQSRYANLAASELDNLTGAQKRAAQKELSENLDDQSHKLQVVKKDFELLVESVLDSNKTNKEAYRIWAELRTGAIGVDEAYARLNKASFVTPEQINQLTDSKKKVNDQENAVKTANEQMNLVKTTGANAKQGFGDAAEGAKQSAEEVKRLNEKLKDFNKSLIDKEFEAKFKLRLVKEHGYDESQADDLFKLYKDSVAKGFSNIQKESGQLQREIWSLDEQRNKILDARNAKEKEHTNELEKQLKVLQVNAKVKSLDSKYDIGSKEVANGIPRGLILSMIMQESRGDTFRNGKLLTSPVGAAGVAQFMPATAKQYGVDVRSEESSINGMIKMMSDLIRQFGGNVDKAIMAYNAGAKNVQNGKAYKFKETKNYLTNIKGYQAGLNGFTGTTKDFDSSIADIVKFQEKSKDIELSYADAKTKRLNDHEKKLSDLKIHFSGDTYAKLERQENEQYANENRLADLQFDQQINGWKWVGEEKLKKEAEIAKAQISVRTDMLDIDKQLNKEHIDELRDYELESYRLAKDQRLLDAKSFFMSEIQLAQAKYDIEQRLLKQSNENPQEKEFKSKMLELQNQMDMDRRLKDASMGWDSVRSQMTGSTGHYQINQDRFSRMDSSQKLFDTQIADVERQEKEPGADLKKLAEVREQIWQAHNQRMIDIENQYQKDSVNLQLTQAQQLTGSFANMFRGILGESSGAYRTMYQMQQGFAITQAGMNLWSSVSDAYAKEPGTVWQKVAAGAKAALDQGTFLAMIQSITPQGFATGGHITGKGTGTSDDIPIMASNGEFMMRYAAVQKLGLPMMEYINKTGELPFQREYEALKMQFSMPNKKDTSAFRDGGLVGVSRMSNAEVERRQFDSIQQGNSVASQPKVTIINQTSQPVEAQSEWDGNELKVILTEMQKQNEAQTKSLISQSWRDAERQGGPLDRIKRSK